MTASSHGDHGQDRGNGATGPDPAATTTTMLPAMEPPDPNHLNGSNGANGSAQRSAAPIGVAASGPHLASAKTDHIPQTHLNAPVPPPIQPVPPPVQQVQPVVPPQPQPAKPARSASIRRGAERAPRRAHLQLKHIDAWSVLKLACVLSVALFFVWLIIVAVLYGALDVSGVVQRINDTAHKLYNNTNDPVTPGLILGGALVIGVVNIVLFIVLTTIGAVVYNLCSDLVGGVEVTLSER